MYQRHPPLPPSETLPTMYDLPSENPEEPGLPDEFHDFQPKLLRETCQPKTYPADQIFIGADLNLYYDPRHSHWYKRPDWFLVLGVSTSDRQADLRWSYVIWQEGVSPFLVVELLSPGTENEDLGQTVRELGKPPVKWQVYERILRVPFYAVYDRYQTHLRLFRLEGDRYKEVTLSESKFWFDELDIGLGIWQGAYQGIQGRWIRWYDSQGTWLPTLAETAQAEAQARQLAEQQAQTEAQARQLAEQQAQTEAQARRAAIPRLAHLGLTAPQIAESLDLPLAIVEAELQDLS